MMKKWISMLLAVLIVLSAAQIPSFAREPDTLIPDFGFSVFGVECGQDPADCPPDGYTYPADDDFDDESVTVDSTVWIAGYDEATGEYQPLETPFVGGQTYAALVVLDAAPGFAFGETTRVFTYDADDELVECAVLRRSPEQMTVRVEVLAEHEWDTVEYIPATCVREGYAERVCTGDPSHTETEILEIDPDAHDWGDWTVLREPTKALEGERSHTCALCGAVENESIPKIT